MNRPFKIVLALLCGLGLLFGGIWLGGHPDELPTGLRDAFVDDQSALSNELVEQIEDSYYKKVDRSDLEQKSLKAIVKSLGDRFSNYFTPKEAKLFFQATSGQFDGVGMSVDEAKRGLLVVNVFEGSPAEKAGIHKDDIITKVNGKSIAGEAADIATAKIKGKPGTEVTLTVLDPKSKKERKLRIKRKRITVPAVEEKLETVDGVKIGVVKLTEFSDGAHGQLREEIDKLIDDGAKGIVLDLRGNGGGLLREAVLVSSIFVESGPIVSTKGRTQPERKFDATGDAIDEDIPVVVLVDRGSASASEIVTGALRDRKRAKVVGTRTFGKGVFQEVEPLSNGGALDITVGRYFLPNGEPVSGKGINAEVEARDDPKTDRDEALPIALETLRKQIQSQ